MANGTGNGRACRNSGEGCVCVCAPICLHVNEREKEREGGKERGGRGRAGGVKVGFPFLSIEDHDKGDLNDTSKD